MLSTGDAPHEINFNASPTTLIVGENGSGKSTLLDAICFGLFGRPFRKINKPQLVNSVNEKNLLVEIYFSIGKIEYEVRRGIKPNIFEIVKNGQMVDQSSKSRDYQKFLEENILGFNFKSFTQIVILGASSFVPFMQLSAADRRSIVEDLLGIEIFSTMNMLSKEHAHVLENEHSAVNYQYQLTQEKIDLTQKHVDDLENNNKKLIDKNKKDMKESQDEIFRLTKLNKDCADEIKDLIDSIVDQNKNTDELDLIKKYESQIKTRSRGGVKEKKFFETHESCPTCLQDINADFRTEMIAARDAVIVELDVGLSALKAKYSTLNRRAKEIQEVQNNILEINNSMLINNGVITTTEGFIQERKNDIAALEITAVGDTSSDIDSLHCELKTIEEKIKILVEEKHYNGVVLNLLKDTGIKARIVAQYLPIMNKLINKYLAELDFFVTFELDDQFTETMKSRFRDIFSYSNFSEGEKQRIDIALLLTWRTIAGMRNSTSTNLLLFDEVFDASLDASGCDELIKILNNISGSAKTNIFVISHKTDILLDKFEDVIRFSKKNNFSRMEKV